MDATQLYDLFQRAGIGRPCLIVRREATPRRDRTPLERVGIASRYAQCRLPTSKALLPKPFQSSAPRDANPVIADFANLNRRR